MTTRPVKAIVFDIDGTLTPGNSWTAFTRDLGASVDDHMSIFRSHVRNEISLDESKVQLLELWLKTGKATKAHIEAAYDTRPIRPDAANLINWLKQEGYIVCLITGSVGLYAQHIATRLGVKEWYANGDLFFDWKGDLVSFHYTTDQVQVKLDQFSHFCARLSLQPQECVAVGDGENDVGLFELTQRGILIAGGKESDGYHDHVSPALRAVAWREVECLERVQGILENECPASVL